MQILLIGKGGQLGWELDRKLHKLGQVTAVDYPEIDLQKADVIRQLVRQVQPQLIINAAAYTAVDQAETDREPAWLVNAIAPGVLAEEAKRLQAVFVHYSTDYVFDGKKGEPYTENDLPSPLNYYGQSKLGGEQRIQAAGGVSLIFRTSWVYSLRSQGGFVNKVLQWARQKEVLRIVADQVSNPTWARMLAEITVAVLSEAVSDPFEYFRSKQGLYHLAGAGYVSRLDWARRILELDPNPDQQIVRSIEPATTDQFPAPAERPLFSALDCTRVQDAFGLHLPAWDESLRLAMETA